MPYITWEYYNSLYNDVTDEKEFNQLLMKAETKLNTITHMRAKEFVSSFHEETATNFQKQVAEQVKQTVCELINAIYQQETHGMGTGIVSVSNDGYSESYKITTAAEKETQIYGIVRADLSGTGLVGAL